MLLCDGGQHKDGAVALPVPTPVSLRRQAGIPPPGWRFGTWAELELEVLQICSWYLPLLVAQGDDSGAVVRQSSQRHIFMGS